MLGTIAGIFVLAIAAFIILMFISIPAIIGGIAKKYPKVFLILAAVGLVFVCFKIYSSHVPVAGEKISLQVTGIEIEGDSVAVKMIVKNDDWLPHSVCVWARGTLYGIHTDNFAPDEKVLFDQPTRHVCVKIGEHSSQIVAPSAHEWLRGDEATGAMRRGYKSFEACGWISSIDDVNLGEFVKDSMEPQCVLFSGP